MVWLLPNDQFWKGGNAQGWPQSAGDREWLSQPLGSVPVGPSLPSRQWATWPFVTVHSVSNLGAVSPGTCEDLGQGELGCSQTVKDILSKMPWIMLILNNWDPFPTTLEKVVWKAPADSDLGGLASWFPAVSQHRRPGSFLDSIVAHQWDSTPSPTHPHQHINLGEGAHSVYHVEWGDRAFTPLLPDRVITKVR